MVQRMRVFGDRENMQPTWPTFALGVILGVGVTIAIGFSIDARFPAFPDFCDKKETLLTCSRNWANAFAILAGAAVVAVTIRGQREEQDRHRETMQIAKKADALRISRAAFRTAPMRGAANRILSLVDQSKDWDSEKFRDFVRNYQTTLFDSINRIATSIDLEEVETIADFFNPMIDASRRNCRIQSPFCMKIIREFLDGNRLTGTPAELAIWSPEYHALAAQVVRDNLTFLFQEAFAFCDGIATVNREYNSPN